MWKIVCSILSLLISVVFARHVTLLGPLISNGGESYKALIVTSGYPRNAELGIMMNCQKDVSSKKVFSLDTDLTTQEIEFELPKARLGACQIYSVVKQGNYCTKDEITIENKFNNFLLIQTDKPVYKPGEKVSFQVIALNNETKPVPFKKISIEVYDSKDNLVLTTNPSTEKTKQNYGFYQSEVWLSDEPNLGNWRIQATVDELSASLSKSFQVNYYNLPPFKLYIETNPKVSFNEKNLNLNLFAKYSFDKFVKGKAKIIATVRLQSKPNSVVSTFERTIEIKDEKTLFLINLKNDLQINFMVKNVIVILDIEFEEENTEVKVVESRQVLIFPKGKHIIDVERKERFRPGFPYKVIVAISTFDGAPEKSQSIPVTVDQKYEYEGGQYGRNAKISAVSFLKDGSAQFILYPAENTKSMELTFTYDQTKVSEKIERIEHKNTDEFLQAVLLNNKVQVGDTININVQTNAVLEELNVAIFGKSGIVYSKKFHDFEDPETFNISIVLTEAMAPTADIIVFYLRDSDGVMIHDQIRLNLGFKGSNFLSLDVKDGPYKIKQNVQIDATTQAHSLVALLAVDQAVTFMGTNNLISQSVVDLNLYPDSNDYSYKMNDKRFVFGSANAFKISPTSEKRRVCREEENRIFFRGVGPTVGLEWLQPTPEISTNKIRKNFPEVWFEEVQEVQDGSFVFLKNLPDSITTWIVNGFSISPEHGFAVADPARINVFQDFFIRVEKPHVVKLNEIVSIKVIVHNYMNADASTTVTLKNTNNKFEFIEGKQVKKSTSKSLPVQVPRQSVAVATFSIRPVDGGKVQFTVHAKSNNVEDEVKDHFLVNMPGVTKHDVRSVIVNLNNNISFHEEMTFGVDEAAPNSINFEAVTSTDLLGPALENVENLIKLPEGCGEQKMRIISSTIMAKKYLNATSQLTKSDEVKFNHIFKRSYQDLIALQNKDGSFNLWGTNHAWDIKQAFLHYFVDKDYLDLTAYAVKLLSQLDSIPDQNVIPKAMKYIEQRQKRDGSFESLDGAQFKDLKQYSNIEGVSLTAYILVAIFESESLRANHRTLVNNALHFIEGRLPEILEQGTNYERALTFYVYVLADKDYNPILNRLYETAKRSDEKLYWNLNDVESSSTVQVEISSYVVLGLTRLKKYEEANEIVKFLMSKKNPQGGFASTTDTVLGLQALAEISKILYKPGTNINFKLRNQHNQEVLMSINSKVQKRSVSKDLPPSTRSIGIDAEGRGVAGLQITCTYKQKIQNFQEHFVLKVNPRKERDNFLLLNICVATKRRQSSNMAVIEIEMPSGYTHRHGPSQENNQIKKITRLDDGAKVLIYLSEVNSTEICLPNIEGVQTAQVDNLDFSEVKIFDYYEPEKIAIQYYKP